MSVPESAFPSPTWQRRPRARLLAPLLTLLAFLLIGAAPAGAAAVGPIAINEIESDAPGGGPDFVELTNTSGATVDIGGYVLKDSTEAKPYTVPAATMLAPGGIFSVNVGGALFGLGKADAVRLFDPLAALVDSFSWTADAFATFGLCPDTGSVIVSTRTGTPNAPNDCYPAGVTWPGGTAIAAASDTNFGSNLSGLVYQPSGTSSKGVLWAVQNGPSKLWRLIYDGTKWTPDAANGWATGKQLLYPGGTGVPDAEGVTLVPGDASHIFVSTERNDSPPADTVSRPAVLRFDTSAAGATLTATRDWNLTASLPGLPANAGLEAISWIPDTQLVAKGFVDSNTGVAYSPASYPDHGAGLFVVGVEDTGEVVAYALNQNDDTNFTKVATFSSGFPTVMDLAWDPEINKLRAVCDDSCNGQTTTLNVDGAGLFTVDARYARPSGMPNFNNEGFAAAPQAECVAGLKPAFWADDTNDAGVALRSGTLNCTVLPVTTPDPTTPMATTPVVGSPPVSQPGPAGPAPTPPDTTAPSLKLALTFKASGKFAVRSTGKFALDVTLGETSDITISGTVKKTSKSRTSKTLLKPTTRKATKAGKQTLTLTLSKSAKKALKKGYSVTITVVAKDAAGNTTTTKTTAKVK